MHCRIRQTTSLNSEPFCHASRRGHVLPLFRRHLLASAFDDLVALLCLHVLEPVDKCKLLLLGCIQVSIYGSTNEHIADIHFFR